MNYNQPVFRYSYNGGFTYTPLFYNGATIHYPYPINRLIFLDIDGPINTTVNIHKNKKKGLPTSSHKILLPSNTLHALINIVSYTGAQIVISSSWRKDDNALRNFSNQLSRIGGIKFIDTTPKDYEREYTRGEQIQQYLDAFKSKYGYEPKYIIIDDEISDIINHHPNNRILKTTISDGITRELSFTAMEMLTNPFL